MVEKLRDMKLAKVVVKKADEGIQEALIYVDFTRQHWTCIRAENSLNREIKHRTKAIDAFPDGQSALILVCARLHHVSATSWGIRRYMNMDHLFKQKMISCLIS